jgi:Ca2+-binding EF-hand superfamily protein
MNRLSNAARNAVLVAAAAVPLALSAVAAELSAMDRVVMEAMFSKADTNDDGQLTQSEALRWGVIPERFDALDSNGDGVLDLEEFAAGFAPAH